VKGDDLIKKETKQKMKCILVSILKHYFE